VHIPLFGKPDLEEKMGLKTDFS
jgi:hypothetical protein